MRGELVLWLLLGLGVMGVLGLLRFRFALRFWTRMRQFGYLYVALVVLLALVSLLTGKRL